MMRKRATRKISLFLLSLITVTVLTIAACNSNTVQQRQREIISTAVQTNKSALARTPVATKVVNDTFGSVEIPLYPQRVVVLDDIMLLDIVLALGIKPVGITSCYGCPEPFRGIPSDLVAGIPDVGIAEQPSLEKILSLKPDLILSTYSTESDKQFHLQLSKITPTVAVDYVSLMNFKERLKYVAQVLGKSDCAEEILAQYEDRIHKLRQHLGSKLKTTVSIIFSNGSSIQVLNQDVSPYGQVVNDVGLQQTQVHKEQKSLWVNKSIETLPEYDADFLFIISYKGESLSFLKQPIWSALKAVQNKQVYAVRWDVGGPIGVNRIIDDLYKYLVDTP